jgi:hypothetical protein
MPWLKRNLWLVVGGVVALGLLGVAGFFLYSKIQAEAAVTAALTAQREELDQINNLDPHPGDGKVNNIEAAKQQEKELLAFVAKARPKFVPLDYPTQLNGGQFKLLLDTTLADLQRAGERAGVKLQQQYAFTFSAQKPQMTFDQNSIQPLAMQLTEIRAVCEMLFKARVVTLDRIRRIGVASQDTPGLNPSTSDYITHRKAVTNELAVVMPYEFVFHCFSGELARVLESLYTSPHPFVVKNVVVDTEPASLLSADPNAPEGEQESAAASAASAQARFMQRYGGMRGMRGMAPPPPVENPAAPGTTKGGLSPMIDEKPFRVILWLDVVRLKPLAPPAPAAPAGRAARKAAADGSEPAADSATSSN